MATTFPNLQIEFIIHSINKLVGKVVISHKVIYPDDSYRGYFEINTEFGPVQSCDCFELGYNTLFIAGRNTRCDFDKEDATFVNFLKYNTKRVLANKVCEVLDESQI